MGRDCQHFYCWWHARFFPAEKLLVCQVRGCRWQYEAFAEDAYRLKQAEKRKKHGRRTAGVGDAGCGGLRPDPGVLAGGGPGMVLAENNKD